jgi:hypothetical protein
LNRQQAQNEFEGEFFLFMLLIGPLISSMK